MDDAPDPALVLAGERAERAAFADIREAAPPAMAAAIGLAHAAFAGAFAIASRALQKRMYNHVFSLGLEERVSDADLDALEAFFAHAGSARVRIALAPGAHAATLATRLAARGFRVEDRWLRLVRDTATRVAVAAPRTTLEVRALGAADAAAFGTLISVAFGHPESVGPWLASLVGRPRWRVLGAFDGADLVACGALFAASDTGWLGLGATAASHRRRGAQSALIAARIDAARALGLGRLAVETADDTPEKPNPSTHNLRRLGFRDLYARPNWLKVLREP